MNSINVSKWRRFRLFDDGLFNIDMGTKLDRVKMSMLSPTVNFVGRANTNNGITARVDKIADLEPYSPGQMTLSLGGEYLGSCFIQPDYFYTSQNVVVLIPKWEMPFEVKQFIATMIFRESRTYYKAFIDELNRHIKTDFSFLLPVVGTGEPNWQYMYDYMNSITKTMKANITRLRKVDDTKRSIETKNWRVFRLTDVFRMNNTKSIVQKDIVLDSGPVPYVTSQAGNNGVFTHINCPNEWLEPGNCIMIGGKTLSFSYQEEDFCSNDSHNIVLYCKDERGANELSYLFLIVALKASLGSRYSWGDSISMKRIQGEVFRLPVDQTGNPDWEYMQAFIQDVIKRTKKDVNIMVNPI